MAEPAVFGGIDCSAYPTIRCPHCGARYRWDQLGDMSMIYESEEFLLANYYRLVRSVDEFLEGDYIVFLYFCVMCNDPRPMASTVDVIGPNDIPTSITLLVADPNCPPP